MVVNAIKNEDLTGHTSTLAFVIMPDHFHWLFQLTTDRSISLTVNNVKAFSAKRINRHLRRTGPIWQKGFYDRAIRGEDDVVGIARYILANPLRAGICSRLGDYPLWDAIWIPGQHLPE